MNNKELSYIMGLLQTDGHHQASSRNRGKITLELAKQDRQILEDIKNVLPVKSVISDRKRNTNFKADYESSTLSVYDLGFRQQMHEYGLPIGKKSTSIELPSFDFSRPDYTRGLLDGDGSLGFTARGYPFISFVTKSIILAEYIAEEYSSVGATRTTKANKRDSAINIMITSNAAQRLAHYSYTGGLAMERKQKIADSIKDWAAPNGRYGVVRQRWLPEYDAYLLSHTIQESMEKLNRSKKSIQTRLWRLCV